MSRRKKVGDSNGWVVPVIALGGVGAILYFVFKDGNPFASGANTANNTGVDQQTAAAGAAGSTAGQALPDSQINSIATAIFNAGAGNDGDTVSRQLALLVNQADFNRLYQIFGTKQGSTSMLSTCAWLGFNCQSLDLGAWCNSILTDDQRSEINATLSANGINFTF